MKCTEVLNPRCDNMHIHKSLKVHVLLKSIIIMCKGSIQKTFKQKMETKEKEARCHIPGRV